MPPVGFMTLIRIREYASFGEWTEREVIYLILILCSLSLEYVTTTCHCEQAQTFWKRVSLSGGGSAWSFWEICLRGTFTFRIFSTMM